MKPEPLQGKDLLSIRDLSPEEILFLLDMTDSFREVNERDIKKVPSLRGKTVVNLFFEPSTRTRTQTTHRRVGAVTHTSSSSNSNLNSNTRTPDKCSGWRHTSSRYTEF